MVASVLPATREAPDPLEPPLFDAQGRKMSYLRLSVTDRCNFRCKYCSPAFWGGIRDLLTPPEFERFARVFAHMGIVRVRLTGGEPLLRPDILDIASRISSVPGIRSLAITTNASRLSELAAPLRRHGVRELNVSLDTLREDVFRRISSQGSLGDVLAGIEAARVAGFESIKLNAVVMKGVNDDEVGAIVRYAHARGFVPRFIELMPFGQGEGVPTATLIERLAVEGLPLVDEGAHLAPEVRGPARYLRGESGLVGFISPITGNFCGGCNRVRVTAKGELRACLGGRTQVPLAQLVRGGATDADLAIAIRRALGDKQMGHRFTEEDGRVGLLPMMGVGG